MFFDLANHSSPITHIHPASTPGVMIFVTADRVLWRGETTARVECAGSLPQECLPEDPVDAVNWAEA
jgi:hypothetical protein